MNETYQVIGKSIPRRDARQEVTGRLTYTEDLYRPGMLIAKIKYSDEMHAKILRVDTLAAEKMPGVHAVITGKDIPHNRNGSGFYNLIDQPVLADEKVCYRGDPIAVVAAETRKQAEDAAAAVKVEYEPLPKLFTIEEAMADGAPRIHPDCDVENLSHHMFVYDGDISDRMFDRCDVIVENDYFSQKIEHAPIEPHAAIAEVLPDGSLDIVTTTSRPFNFLGTMTSIMQMPASQLRIRSVAVGGSFGAKNDVSIEPLVAVLALKTGRPVKLVYTREEEMGCSSIRHPFWMHYRTGATKEGKLVANQAELWVDDGAYFLLGKSVLMKAIVHAAGPYYYENVKTDGYLVYTNTRAGSNLRGMGVPQVGFAIESQLDILAEQLGMSPVELRKKNMFGDVGHLPNGQEIGFRGEVLRATMDRAWELFEKAGGSPEDTAAAQ